MEQVLVLSLSSSAHNFLKIEFVQFYFEWNQVGKNIFWLVSCDLLLARVIVISV